MDNPKEYFLDGNARPCKKSDAQLISTQFQTPEERPFKREELRPYNPSLGTLAEGDAAQRSIKKMGEGRCEGDKMEVAGFEFHCGPTGNWEYETTTCKIEVEPTADQEDVKTWLKTFRPVEQKIINRGISGKKLTFELGGKQLFKKTVAAEAIETLRLIRFPTTSDGHHIMAVCMETGSKTTDKPISLQGILLHEIGHTLEPLLRESRDFLRTAMEGKMLEIMEDLKQISPHYLLGEFPKIASLLKKAAGCETLTFQGENHQTEELIEKLVTETSHELFAELLRHFYLEPALTGEIPTQRKTSWQAFNNLVETLTREARYTLRKNKGGIPLFPATRQKQKILPLEMLQDWTSP